MPRTTQAPDLECHPLTPNRWPDFRQLFGKNGACGGCWCMWWRQARAEFEKRHGEGNRRAMKRLVDRGEIPGILGYLQKEPIGWCSIAPREHFASLERSRVLKRLDELPVWSLVCLFVHKDRRGRGVAAGLVAAAVAYARSQNARIIEAYPTATRGRRLPAISSFMGTPQLFRQAGFVECARPSQSRVVMRYHA